MFFHFMLEVELGVTNIASEIPLFFVNCLHVLFEIALAYKTSSTNLTDFHVLEKIFCKITMYSYLAVWSPLWLYASSVKNKIREAKSLLF